VPNIRLHKLKNPSSFRKIAASAWPMAQDPTIYGGMEVRAEKLTAWLAAESERLGTKLSVTHAAARALAIILARHPDLNGIVRHGGIYLRDSVDLMLQVAIPSEDGSLGKTDLSAVVLRGVDGKDIGTIATELRERARKVRKGDDKDFKKTKSMLDVVPSFLLRPLLKLIDFLQFSLNLDLSWAGFAKDAFGSAMVTSVGMFGIKQGYAPIFPLAHIPILLMVCAVEDKPVVEDGKLAVGSVLNLTASFDHRMVDGFHAGKISGEIRELLENPEGLAMAPATEESPTPE
jgi:pyruvate/2-oxoglutarate dehydrogenase complex dihydrolipoamide acyltransferase (E2) component